MIQQSHDIVSMLGVADQYHAVDDVAEVNGFIPPMLPGSFLYEKEPGYEAKPDPLLQEREGSSKLCMQAA